MAVVLIRIVLLLISADIGIPVFPVKVLKEEMGRIELILSHRVDPPPFDIKR
jgi:hypothetical protein